jgi:hypothetical protein
MLIKLTAGIFSHNCLNFIIDWKCGLKDLGKEKVETIVFISTWRISQLIRETKCVNNFKKYKIFDLSLNKKFNEIFEIISKHSFLCTLRNLKLSCDSRFEHAFTACVCVFKVITLVWVNQDNYFENANACSKRTLKMTVSTHL